MTSTIVWLNGELVDARNATVSVFDKGFLAGDGVFETLKVISGQPFALSRHLRRLAKSAAMAQMPLPSSDEIASAVSATVDANPTAVADVGRLRITVTRAPSGFVTAGSSQQSNVVVTVEPQPAHPATLRLVTSPWPHNDRGLLVGAKTTSYADNLAILRWAKSRGADEALMPDTSGRVCEATTANVFIGIDAQLVTPTLRTGCLGGITRELLVEWGIVVERDVLMADLEQASEMLVASSTRDLIPVAQLDDRDFAAPGPLGTTAMAMFAARARTAIDP